MADKKSNPFNIDAEKGASVSKGMAASPVSDWIAEQRRKLSEKILGVSEGAPTGGTGAKERKK